MFFRSLFGIPGAAAITALLFLAMAWMIKQDAEIGTPPPKIERVVATIDEPTVTPKPINKKLPPAPEPIEITRTPPAKNPGGTFVIDPVTPSGGGGGIDIDLTGTKPAVTFAPMYPENCRARGAQGVVVVEFDVTADGQVVNPRVIASENSCLNRAATTTISKWKYTPKKDSNGRLVPQRNLRQSFKFELTDA
ncbi:MAG TPA: TonB family protein [Parvularculaceae bacterium]|nr:TonB family protein [Parvularculaceae bacterium]